jgi:hypothetical protein
MMRRLNHFKEQHRLTLLRRARSVSLIALALALPGAAFPYSLQQLLRLPLETLQTLEITPVGKATAQRTTASASLPVPARSGASRG